jgi:hypothetical protein
LLTTAASASAEVGSPQGTVQQAAADALFLQYAPPPAHPGIVCMVDSGVDPNPDTTPAVVGSYSLQPGTDTADEFAKVNPPIDGHPDGHGTYMAMVMAAPHNGWGMVGIAPTSVRVYSVKALASGHTTFSFGVYNQAINWCQNQTSVRVVNLSLGNGAAPTGMELSAAQNAVASARQHGLDVVAAAGNTGGGVEYPAAISGVFAVGGTDANPASVGVFCSFSNRGAQLQVLAPGCGSQSEGSGGGGLDMSFEDDGSPAWGQGTSEATAEVSAVLASMRAYDPTMTVSQAEQCVTSTEVRGGNLDAAKAFDACGLGSIVDRGNSAYQTQNTVPAISQSWTLAPSGPGASARGPLTTPVPLPTPRLDALVFRRHTLSVHVLNLPRRAQMTVRVDRRLSKQYVTAASKTVASAWAHMHVSGWDRVLVRFVGLSARPQTSATAVISRAHRWGGILPGQGDR